VSTGDATSAPAGRGAPRAAGARRRLAVAGAALRSLHQPQSAYDHFVRLYDAATLPISIGRGAYWAARAGLLARSGERAAAEAAYERAIGLEADPAVRDFLQRRRSELGGRVS